MYGQLREPKESRIEAGHLMAEHLYRLISIPPKYPVSQVIGFIKGKSAIHLARVYGERERTFVGQHFLSVGVFCFDGGPRQGDDSRVHPIRHQEGEDQRLDRLKLWR